MEYCFHVWAGAAMCYYDILDKLQKPVCRSVGLTLAASIEPLAHCVTVTSQSLSYGNVFCRCSFELLGV